MEAKLAPLVKEQNATLHPHVSGGLFVELDFLAKDARQNGHGTRDKGPNGHLLAAQSLEDLPLIIFIQSLSSKVILMEGQDFLVGNARFFDGAH